MELFAISLSYKTAPLAVLERLAFTKKKQAQILRAVTETLAEECVIVSTCNRSEFYLAAESDISGAFLEYLKTLGGGFDFSPYTKIYKNESAVRHLAETAAGLLSMIVGEDQILGQVKDAHAFAAENGASGVYLNTLFRLAVTGAKRVKTDTLLSKTPVSAATIAIKLCENELGSLDKKNALVIGASGKMGGIVFKDLRSLRKLNLFVTSRTHNVTETSDFDGARVIDYADRYAYLDDMDVVISATASPHYTLTAKETAAALKTEKKRIFIDLAVPKDIEGIGGGIYKNIDDLRALSEENNRKKLAETKKAEAILERYVNEFLVWRIFRDAKPFIEKMKFENKSERDAFYKKLYSAKAKMNYKEFARFMGEIKNG